MDDTAANFCINDNFNANYDITWSFQYSVSGNIGATGGFCTFLFNNPTLGGGGRYTGLGYAPYLNMNGVSGAVLGIMIDSNNNIEIKQGSTFNTISTFPLFSQLSPLVKQVENYYAIRFNLTNLGKTLNIAVKKNNVLDYINVKSVNINLPITYDTFYKIGFSYASPLSFNGKKMSFKLKDIQIQGNKNIPTTTISIKPYVINSYYLLQSPASAKIKIHYTDPTSSGYILHK
jgi:hypothetical protein